MEDNCPPTPLQIRSGRSSKSPNQLTVSSPDSDGRKSPSGRLSPDSRCVICLGKLQKKSFTDSCLHQFCFQCLLQWSKVKPECPLCKQPFKSIIHNVRSNCDYDQYHIERREPAYVVSEILHSYDFDLVPVDRRFRYRSTMTREYFGELAESFLAHTRTAYQVPNFVSPPTYHIPSSGRFSPVPERRAARGGSDFRRSIYAQDLWVEDLVDITGRYRECTPQFYRDNPAQIHRIIPWLNREINSLLNDNESYTSYVLDRIVSLLPQYSIRSREFRDAVEPYFGSRTDHFIHELYTFARSVYDISGFDQNAVYSLNPNYGTVVQEISSSNDDSEIEVIGTLHEKNSVRSSRSRRSNRFRKSSRPTGEGSVHSVEPVPGPSGINSRRMTETIDVCESDNDDIKIIEYVKPEPEVVVVSSGDEEIPNGSAEGRNRSRRGGNTDVSSSESHLGRPSRSGVRRGRRYRNGLEKGKFEDSGLKGRQTRNSRKMRKKRSSSCSSSGSSRTNARERSASFSLASFSNVSVDNDSSSSITIQDGSSSSDNEPIAKLKRKKLSKPRSKKGKKCDRKSLVKDKEVKVNDSSHETRKKTKVKSCVVVPSSSSKRPACETAWENSRKNAKFVPSDNRRSDSGISSPLPSYWSLMLDNKSEKHKKRKRSRERKRSLSGYRGSRHGVEAESDDEKPLFPKKRGSCSPGRSNTNDSFSDSIETFTPKSNGSILLEYPKRTNSASVKSENSVEITSESRLNGNSEDEIENRRNLQCRQNVRDRSSSILARSGDTCDESRFELPSTE